MSNLFVIFLFLLPSSWKLLIAQTTSCTPQLAVFSPLSSSSGLVVFADTLRPGVPAGCLEVGVQLMGSAANDELVQSALIRIEEVSCTGDENPVLLFEKLTERALPFGALSFPFDSELIGRPGEETICYFIIQTVRGTANGKCYKLSADYVMNCGATGTAFSYFYMEPDFCFFRDDVPDFRADRTTICAGECVEIEPFNLQIPDDFEWHFVGGEPEFSTRFALPPICYDEPGIYPVEMIAGSCLRMDTIYKTDFIEVLPPMELTSAAEQQFTVNEGEQIELAACAQGANYTYNWFPRQQLSCWDCPNPTFTAAESTDYQVDVRNAAGCEIECAVDITVRRKPQAAFTPSAARLCVGDCLTLTNQSTFSPTTYEWQLPNTPLERSTEAVPPPLCYSTPGVFSVTLIAKNAVGSDTLVQQIEILPKVQDLGVATQNLSVIANRDFQLNACATGGTYEWQSPSLAGLSCTDCPAPILNVEQPTEYTLVINANSTCETRCLYEIDVAFEPVQIYLPTAFSPNGDGINDTYRWFGKNMQLRQFSIFNRWGALVFQTTDSTLHWTGNFNNEPAAAGVYFCVLTYRDLRTNYEEQISGSITLLR